MPQRVPGYQESRVDAVLGEYFAKRQAARADRVRVFLDNLTDREQALVTEIAVVGYAQGLKRPREQGCPKDSQIVSLVLDAGGTLPESLTARERALVRDIAVMGYVQGLMRPETADLQDSDVVDLVVDACFAFPDQYPVVATLERCPGFPEGCPNLRVTPADPSRPATVRCGCADDPEGEAE